MPCSTIHLIGYDVRHVVLHGLYSVHHIDKLLFTKRDIVKQLFFVGLYDALHAYR